MLLRYDNAVIINPFMLKINEQIDEQFRNGHYEESNAVRNLLIVVAKKKVGSLCVCVDYRKLNSVTDELSFPLPTLTYSWTQWVYTNYHDLR